MAPKNPIPNFRTMSCLRIDATTRTFNRPLRKHKAQNVPVWDRQIAPAINVRKKYHVYQEITMG
jgi:uncharacterized protein YeaO (DUF488 family)